MIEKITVKAVVHFFEIADSNERLFIVSILYLDSQLESEMESVIRKQIKAARRRAKTFIANKDFSAAREESLFIRKCERLLS